MNRRRRRAAALLGAVGAGAFAAPPGVFAEADAQSPNFPLIPGPNCSAPNISWKFAAAVGAPDGPPSVNAQNAAINGFNKWLGTGMRQQNGANLFSVVQNNNAAFKVYFRELGAIGLGGYSCSWNMVLNNIPAGPAIVIDPAALPLGTTAFTHEMGHALGLNHSGMRDSLDSWTNGYDAAMNTCRDPFPFNVPLGRDDYAQAQFRRNGTHTANPGFESTSVGWDYNGAAIEPNGEQGSGVNSMRLNANTGWASTAARVYPGKSRVLISARFKGAAAVAGGGRFKTFYRHTLAQGGAAANCQFYNNLNLNALPANALPAFQLLYSGDFNLSTSWSSLPAFTGANQMMPPAPPAVGEWTTDFMIKAQNNTPGTAMWVDNLIGVAI